MNIWSFINTLEGGFMQPWIDNKRYYNWKGLFCLTPTIQRWPGGQKIKSLSGLWREMYIIFSVFPTAAAKVFQKPHLVTGVRTTGFITFYNHFTKEWA